MNRTKVIGYLALGMVAVALTAVLCVTLQQGKEAGEARKIKQMESRVTGLAAPGSAGAEGAATQAVRR